MPTTTPDNIFYADSSSAMSAEAISAAEATSVQEAFDNLINDSRQQQNYFWTDSSGRTSQTGMRVNDLGYQADTDITYRYNGTAWRVWEKTPTAYTPAVTGGTRTGGIVKYSIGSGMVYVSGSITLSAVSGDFSIGIPSGLPIDTTFVGAVAFEDVGTNIFWGTALANSSTAIGFYASLASGTYASRGILSSTIPFTWASGDSIRFSVHYETTA